MPPDRTLRLCREPPATRSCRQSASATARVRRWRSCSGPKESSIFQYKDEREEGAGSAVSYRTARCLLRAGCRRSRSAPPSPPQGPLPPAASGLPCAACSGPGRAAPRPLGWQPCRALRRNGEASSACGRGRLRRSTLCAMGAGPVPARAPRAGLRRRDRAAQSRRTASGCPSLPLDSPMPRKTPGRGGWPRKLRPPACTAAWEPAGAAARSFPERPLAQCADKPPPPRRRAAAPLCEPAIACRRARSVRALSARRARPCGPRRPGRRM